MKRRPKIKQFLNVSKVDRFVAIVADMKILWLLSLSTKSHTMPKMNRGGAEKWQKERPQHRTTETYRNVSTGRGRLLLQHFGWFWLFVITNTKTAGWRDCAYLSHLNAVNNSEKVNATQVC